MKKIIRLLAIMMASTTTISAQEEQPRHEIGVSYGWGMSFFEDVFGYQILTAVFNSMSGYSWENGSYSGTIGAEYFYHLNNPKLAVGGIVTYAHFGEDYIQNSTGNKGGESSRTYMSFMPGIKYNWVNKKSFGLYSKAAVGLMLVTVSDKNYVSGKDDSSSACHITWQASLLGMEFGKKVRVFTELGLGEQGIFLAGLKYRF